MPLTIEEEFDIHKHPTLGESYFVSRNLVSELFQEVTSKNFKDIVSDYLHEFNKQALEKISEELENSIIDRLQDKIYYMVDEIVYSLLKGKTSALEKYLYSSSYDSHMVREHILKLHREKIEEVHKETRWTQKAGDDDIPF